MKKNLFLSFMLAIQVSAFAQTTSSDPKEDLRTDLLLFVTLASEVTNHIAQLSSKDSLQVALVSLQSQSAQLVHNTEQVYDITEDWRSEVNQYIALFAALHPKEPAAASFFMGKAYESQTNPYPTAPQYYVTLKNVSGYFEAMAKAKTQKKTLRLNKNVQRELHDLSSSI